MSSSATGDGFWAVMSTFFSPFWAFWAIASWNDSAVAPGVCAGAGGDGWGGGGAGGGGGGAGGGGGGGGGGASADGGCNSLVDTGEAFNSAGSAPDFSADTVPSDLTGCGSGGGTLADDFWDGTSGATALDDVLTGCGGVSEEGG
ncbi:MAG: hypothetical protein LBB26_00225 [Puniceicoccales bacterium]|nr:hypothetical protein [Puniceicoccales bacterium]